MGSSVQSILSILLLPFLLPSVQAFNGDEHCRDDQFCLTSFVWCDRGDYNGDCKYPDGFYPYSKSSNVGRAAVLWSHKYELTWQGTDSDYPVLLEWRVSKDQSEEGDPDSYLWQRNFTDGETSFSFEFADLAQEMVDDDDELDLMAIKGRAASVTGNTIELSQPGREFPGVEDNGDVFAYSDIFAVFDGRAEDFFDEQRKQGQNEEYNTWKLGVGIGVGLGVPIFMAAAFAGGFFFGKGRGRRSVSATEKTAS